VSKCLHDTLLSEGSFLLTFLVSYADVGASDAADWAIARSLSALKQAEEKGDLKEGKSEASIGTSVEESSQDRSV